MSQQTRTIDGVAYAVSYLSPDDALRVGIDVAKAGGPAMISALERFDVLLELVKDEKPAEPGQPAGDKGLPREALQALGKALSDLIDRADPVVYLRIVDALMAVTFADGLPLVSNGKPLWKEHFRGKVGRLRKVVWFALGVNFSDFFGGGASTLTSAIARFSSGPTRQES